MLLPILTLTLELSLHTNAKIHTTLNFLIKKYAYIDTDINPDIRAHTSPAKLITYTSIIVHTDTDTHSNISINTTNSATNHVLTKTRMVIRVLTMTVFNLSATVLIRKLDEVLILVLLLLLLLMEIRMLIMIPALIFLFRIIHV